QPERVHEQVAFASGELFRPIVAVWAAALGGLHRLAVEDGGAGRRLASGLLADAFAQDSVDLLPDPGKTPAATVRVHRGPRAVQAWQQAPLTPAAHDRADALEDPAQVHGARASTGLGWRQYRGENDPLLFTQVGGEGRGGCRHRGCR